MNQNIFDNSRSALSRAQRWEERRQAKFNQSSSLNIDPEIKVADNFADRQNVNDAPYPNLDLPSSNYIQDFNPNQYPNSVLHQKSNFNPNPVPSINFSSANEISNFNKIQQEPNRINLSLPSHEVNPPIRMNSDSSVQLS